MLKGKKVILAPPKREYIDTFLKWINDPEITQYLLVFRPMTKEMEEEWFESLKERENDILFSILIPLNDKTEKLIGNCGIHKIVYDFNIPAIKLYKKVGFIEEGRKRKAHFVNGEYHDLIIMGILNEEWKENKNKK